MFRRTALLTSALCVCAGAASAQTIVGQDRDKLPLEGNQMMRYGINGVEVRPPLGQFRRLDPLTVLVPGLPLFQQSPVGGLDKPPPSYYERRKGVQQTEGK